MSDFSERLREARNTKGFTQEELANILNISRNTYTQYETGARKPDIEMLTQISIILDTSADILLGIMVRAPYEAGQKLGEKVLNGRDPLMTSIKKKQKAKEE